MKTRNYTAAALLALFFGLFGCVDDSAFDLIGTSWSKSLPIGNLLIPPTYTVTYEGNGSTGGDVPVDGNEYSSGDLVTVLGNTEGLIRIEGLDTYSFVGWNTASDGSGTPYIEGNIFIMGSPGITLFAQWTLLPTYTVTYYGNTNDGGTVPVDSNNYLEDDEVTVKTNSGGLTKTGYVFAGWYTVPGVPSTGGTAYNPGETFIMGDADFNLYAIWSDQWVQDAYFKASNAEADDSFGYSVAVDGNTIVVGATGEDSNQTTITETDGTASHDNSAAGAGAVYVFKKLSNGNWYQDLYLKASNSAASDNFGASVAVSGSIIAVGATGEDSSQTSIVNEDGSVGGKLNNNGALGAGAVYVFMRKEVPHTWPKQYIWVQDAFLKASNGEASDNLGFSVAIDGNTIVAGATGEDSNQTTVTNTNGSASSNNTASIAGAVYVFKRNTTTLNWYQDAYLKSSNMEASDNFGYSIGVSGNIIVVGAYGEDCDVTSIDNADGDPEPADANNNNNAPTSGAVYVFKLNTTTGEWSQDAYLKASNANASDNFGYSVAVDGDTIVAGACYEDSSQTTVTNSDGSASTNNDVSSSGAAYVFKRNTTTGNWSQDAYLKSPSPDINDYFGYSVGVSGTFIVVSATGEDSDQTTITNMDGSASGDNDASASGAAYVFKKDASENWVQDAYLKASNADALDVLGFPVRISGYTIAVGAIGEDSDVISIDNADGDPKPADADNNNDALASGAVYVFTIK